MWSISQHEWKLFDDCSRSFVCRSTTFLTRWSGTRGWRRRRRSPTSGTTSTPTWSAWRAATWARPCPSCPARRSKLVRFCRWCRLRRRKKQQKQERRWWEVKLVHGWGMHLLLGYKKFVCLHKDAIQFLTAEWGYFCHKIRVQLCQCAGLAY